MRKSFGKRDPSDPAEVGCGGGTSRVEFDLAEAMHRKLCERCGGFTALPAELVQPLLEKAMENYWIMVYKRMRDDCERLMQDYETYRLDNELLDAIERQNSELRALLEGNGFQMPEGAGKTHLNPHREGALRGAAPELEAPDARGEGLKARGEECGRKVRVALELPSGFVRRLSQFFAEKGLFPEDALPLLVEFGLESEDEGALERLREERDRDLPRIDKEYATLRFKAYECFMVNRALTMKLNILLSENRRLKGLCRSNGLLPADSGDEWDGWGGERVGELFRKYVFMNRG